MGILLLLVVLAAAAAVVAVVVLAQRNQASFERSNQLLPGRATSAPASWAGSHEPEARLHRRLRDAMAALRANQAFDDDGRLLDLRVDLEQNAVALDEQLVAVAALPVHLRGPSLEKLAGAVETIEQAVADLAGSSSGEIGERLDLVLADVRERTGLVAQARAALDALADEDPALLAPDEDVAPPVTGTTPPEAPGTDDDDEPGTAASAGGAPG
jgi:hypothetical protein